jgi:hypothetical protein
MMYILIELIKVINAVDLGRLGEVNAELMS